eukprot:scaffold28735_cov63-Phaeocystis_antarctica.AAC.2
MTARQAYDMVAQHGPSGPLAAPQLGSRASSGRAWRLWAARHSREAAGPLGAQPLPRVLERAASKAADLTAFDPSGGEPTQDRQPRRPSAGDPPAAVARPAPLRRG